MRILQRPSKQARCDTNVLVECGTLHNLTPNVVTQIPFIREFTESTGSYYIKLSINEEDFKHIVECLRNDTRILTVNKFSFRLLALVKFLGIKDKPQVPNKKILKTKNTEYIAYLLRDTQMFHYIYESWQKDKKSVNATFADLFEDSIKLREHLKQNKHLLVDNICRSKLTLI